MTTPNDDTPSTPPTRSGVPGDPHLNAVSAAARAERARRERADSPRRKLAARGTGARSKQPPATTTSNDDTPPAWSPIRGAPARQDEQHSTISMMVVAFLLVAALAVAAVLFIGLNSGDEADPEFSSNTTVVPTSVSSGGAPPVSAPAGSDGDETATDTDPGATGDGIAVSTPAEIVAIQAFDPYGDNGQENDTQAGQALADGSGSTSWPTECYSDPYLNGKGGVGLMLTLSNAGTGLLSVDSLRGPFDIAVYGVSAETPPTTLDGWSQIGESRRSEQPGTVEVAVATPSTHLLVWLNELGPDEVCSEANPYRGRLGEISFGP